MKKRLLIIVAGLLALALIGLIVKTTIFSGSNQAALKITTNPKATVFIDGNQVGLTPFFDDEIKIGEHTIKLVPEGGSEFASLEKTVNLVSTALTMIDYTFSPKQSETAGQILSLEKIAVKDKAAISVISDPDQAVVKLNNDPKGFSPLLLENLESGSYQIIVSSPGFEEITISNANLPAGFKLKVEVKLAQKIDGFQEASPSGETAETTETTTPTPSSKPTATTTPAKTTPTPSKSASTTALPEKPYVKIKDTPTGFLRVRLSPSTSASEAARVNPGDTFPYLEEQQNGWYKIEYAPDEEGWVSGVYIDLIE